MHRAALLTAVVWEIRSRDIVASAFMPVRFPNPEILLAAAVVLIAAVAARFQWRWLGCWEAPLARLARHKRWAIVLAGTAPLLVRAMLLPWFPAPEPSVHDEFSYLLGADTLLHGRLVNPQHPLWVHFESMHVLTQPVCVTIYPIGQAVALAAGKLLFGHWWAGVWLSCALMGGAICWMLQGWVPPRWALLGALLLMLRLGISSYWLNSYWGGCVAAAAGALTLGALPRIARFPHWPGALTLGVGLAVLANSRPVEGGAFAVALAIPLFAWMFGRPMPGRTLPAKAGGRTFRKEAALPVILQVVLCLGLAAASMGYYFTLVTGRPWIAPYVFYRSTKTMAPHFMGQTPRPQPLYNNAELRDFYVVVEMNTYRSAQRLANLGEKAVYWRFYVGPLFSLPLLSLASLWRDQKARTLL